MKIKIYKKFELAKLYFPEQSKHVALNHLMRMVNHCPPLRKHPTPMTIQLHPQCLLGIQGILRNWTFLIFKQV